MIWASQTLADWETIGTVRKAGGPFAPGFQYKVYKQQGYQMSILKEINTEYSLEGLMLKLEL